MEAQQTSVSDGNDEVRFERPSDDDLQVVQLEEGQDIPVEAPEKVVEEGVKLSKEQYDELVKGKDSTSLLSNSFKELADKLIPRGPANAPAPVQEYDPLALEEEAYKPGKFAGVVEKLVGRAVNQANAANIPLLQAQSKMLMKLDPATGEYFKRYEAEIERKKSELPMQYQALPNVYNLLYDEVMKGKQVDIIAEKAKAMAEEMVKQMGLTTSKADVKPMYTEGTRSIASASAPKKVVLYLSTVQRDDMIGSGMDPTDKDQVRSYLDDWKAKGRK